MEGEAVLKRYTPFVIVSKDQDVAIVPQAHKHEEYPDAKLGAAKFDPNDDNQLWFV